MASIRCDEFLELDAELKGDLVESFVEVQQEIESVFNNIDDSGFSKDKINHLFRELHSLKGNCAVCFLAPLVDTLHYLEEIIDGIRNDEMTYHNQMGEISVLVLEKLSAILQQICHQYPLDETMLSTIQGYLKRIYDEKQENSRLQQVNKLLRFLKGDRDDEQAQDQQASSLAFFQTLSAKLNPLLGFTSKRNEKLIALSLLINAHCEDREASSQLAAAVYMHNMGLAKVLKESGYRSAASSSVDPQVGADLLAKYPEFQKAANIVLHHQARYDDAGSSGAKVSEQIPQGAFILSMSLIFIDMVCHKHGNEYRQSALEAVRKINLERGKAFPPNLIDSFNQAVKQLLVRRAQEGIR